MVLAGMTLGAVGAPAELPPDGVEFSTQITRTYGLNYLLALPEGYAENRRQHYPIVIFLHGSGERGEDLNVVRVNGPFKEIAQGRKFPFILVAPQCPAKGWWDVEVLSHLLTSIEKKYRVDRDRVYLTGLSMGGYGTWAWATAEPKRFAALAPICGGGDPEQAAKLVGIPTWVTHGDADTAVPIVQSIAMVEAIRKAGGTIRFDIIKGGTHDVWSPVYANPEFYDWLMAQNRKSRP